MVDTINPNTNAPDDWDKTQPPAEPAAPDNRFYGGFDKPDETKINLADNQTTPVAPVEAVASTPEPVQPQPEPKPVPPQPIADVAPVEPAEVKHTSYVNTADMINWRGILVIVAIGLIATLVAGISIYFIASAMNNSKLEEQQVELDSIKEEIVTLSEVPSSLELPQTETETPPVEEAPVIVPVETPVETPVVVPSTPVTPEGNG